MVMRTIVLTSILCCLVPVAASAVAPTRIRGTIASVAAGSLHVVPNGGADTTITVPPDTRITLVEPSSLADIKPGSFIGTAAKTQADGTIVAVEVHVFPESMRGSGEGHRPFDLGPQSTMTNGTVGQEVIGSVGQTLTVRYKGGEKTILVPPGVPVVTFAPGDRATLVAGAHVIVSAQRDDDGTLSAKSLLVGQNGLVPPM